MNRKAEQAVIPRVGFDPPRDYALALEVMSANEWFERVPEDHFKHPTRLEFYQLVLVTQGQFGHMLDFNLLTAPQGTLLVMRSGQVQRFAPDQAWGGWVALFPPEALPPTDQLSALAPALSVHDLPAQLPLEPASLEAARQTFEQMHQDTTQRGALAGHTLHLNALVRTQLHSLLLRLHLVAAQQSTERGDTTQARQFKRFRDATEKHLHEWHQISTYANALGMSEKTLTRATQAMTALSAKAYLSQRIALEAKRVLAHTPRPIAQVADQVGITEPSNIIKFFQSEVGCAPSAFRKQHGWR